MSRSVKASPPLDVRWKKRVAALQSEPSSLHKHAKLTQTQRCGKASAVVIVVANIVVVVVVFVCLYVALSACVVVVVDVIAVVVFVVVVAVDCGGASSLTT